MPITRLEGARLRRISASFLTLFLLVFGWVLVPPAWADVPMLPIERLALREPDQVLKDLPALKAAAAGDERQLALLSLAEANACRVVADWSCQQAAGERARDHALLAGDPVLQARGLIAFGRSKIALGDFYAGELQLAEAETLLKPLKQADLLADVQLGYSSLSHRLGKHQVAADYAEKGLATLGSRGDVPMRVRLQRNLARARAALGDWGSAKQALSEARVLVRNFDDPKLLAEIALEEARIAQRERDIPVQRRAAEEIQQLAAQLRNSQLEGLGLELQGHLAEQLQQLDDARRFFRESAAAFQSLNLGRDEIRVIDQYLRLALDQPDLSNWVVRRLQLESSVSDVERARAAENFEERLRYAQQELAYVRLRSETALLNAERNSMELRSRYDKVVAILAMIVLLALVSLTLLQRRANLKLRDSLQLRQRVMLQTSHEMRNSLVAIRGLSERLSQQSLPAAYGEMVHTIMRGSDHLAALAQDLLDCGRLEAGQLRLTLKATRLPALVQQVHRLHLPLAREKGLSLPLQDQLGELPPVLLDPTRLEQVLTNLLANALKFTDHGSVTLSARCVEAGPRRCRVQFSVTDSGPGIADSEIDTVFRPFGQTSLGTQHAAGAGLGLSISRELVVLMGGVLQVRNVAPHGCRFFFELELSTSNDAIGIDAESDTALDSTTDAGDLRVIAIDDDPVILMIYEGMLNHLGVRPRLYASVDEALAEQSLAEIDLLLLDFELSAGSSVEQVARLRRDANPALRIVVVSGHAAPQQLPAGVDEWVQKPATGARFAMMLAAARRSGRRKSLATTA